MQHEAGAAGKADAAEFHAQRKFEEGGGLRGGIGCRNETKEAAFDFAAPRGYILRDNEQARARI